MLRSEKCHTYVFLKICEIQMVKVNYTELGFVLLLNGNYTGYSNDIRQDNGDDHV